MSLISNYIAQSKCKQIRKLLASFGTGSHWLMVCKGRHQRPFLEYSHWHCCSTTLSHFADDEQHAVFDCCKNDAARSKSVDLFKQMIVDTCCIASNRSQDLAALNVTRKCSRLRSRHPLPVIGPPSQASLRALKFMCVGPSEFWFAVRMRV